MICGGFDVVAPAGLILLSNKIADLVVHFFVRFFFRPKTTKEIVTSVAEPTYDVEFVFVPVADQNNSNVRRAALTGNEYVFQYGIIFAQF